MLAAKLTEQFKKHLVNHESMKKDLYKRFEIVESHLPVYRQELFKLMEQSEARGLSKMKKKLIKLLARTKLIFLKI